MDESRTDEVGPAAGTAAGTASERSRDSLGDTAGDALLAGLLTRLRRIDRLRAGDGAAGALLAELRALVPEAEAWARREGDARAQSAVAKLRREAEGMR